MKKYSRIIIMIIVLLLVLGVYFLKNGQKVSDRVSTAAATKMETAAEEKKNEAPAEAVAAPEVTDPAPAGEVPAVETAEAASTEEAVKTEERIPMEFTVWDDEALFGTGLPLLLDFGSASCGPCQMMKPDLIAFYEENYGKITVRYADVWADPYLTGGLPVSAVPTQFFFNADGTPYEPSEEMSRRMRFSMYVLRDTDEHVLTAHVGALSKKDLEDIFMDMGVEL